MDRVTIFPSVSLRADHMWQLISQIPCIPPMSESATIHSKLGAGNSNDRAFCVKLNPECAIGRQPDDPKLAG